MAQGRPFVEDMWNRLVEVGWGTCVHVEIYGGEGAAGYHLRVIEEGGDESWRFDTYDPSGGSPAAPGPITDPGTVINAAYLRHWRFLQTSVKITELQTPGSGEITGWAQAFLYYPDNDTGSNAGIWDRCLDKDLGLYVGDPQCESLEIGGAVPAGGVSRHLNLQAILLEYGDEENPFKRVHYSRQGSPDERFYFIDDRREWTPDSGITKAAWNAALKRPYDKSFFVAERAIVDGGSATFPRTASWLVNFGYAPPNPPGTPPRPVVIAIDVEEPSGGGADPVAESYVKLRRWSPNFRIDSATGAGDEGEVTTYIGTRSPSYTQVLTPITWGADGVIARFDKAGFII